MLGIIGAWGVTGGGRERPGVVIRGERGARGGKEGEERGMGLISRGGERGTGVARRGWRLKRQVTGREERG